MTTAAGWPRSLPRKSRAEVNEDAIGRLASFERLADDAALTPEQKVALAISGWLVGANQATDNFQMAVSLAHVRDNVRQYLREPLAAEPLASWPPSCATWRGRRSSASRRSSS